MLGIKESIGPTSTSSNLECLAAVEQMIEIITKMCLWLPTSQSEEESEQSKASKGAFTLTL